MLHPSTAKLRGAEAGLVQIPQLEGMKYLIRSFCIISFSFCFPGLFMLPLGVLLAAIGKDCLSLEFISQLFLHSVVCPTSHAARTLGCPHRQSLCGHLDITS